MQIDQLKYKKMLCDLYTEFNTIHIDRLERRWIAISLMVIALFVGIITFDALLHGINPPSKVETIDSASLHLSKEFAEDNLGVQVDKQGAIIIRMVAGRYSFFQTNPEVSITTVRGTVSR